MSWNQAWESPSPPTAVSDNPKSLLAVTKSRSTYGSHAILTKLLTHARAQGQAVKVVAWEHPKETQRWDIDAIWSDLNDVTEVLQPDNLADREGPIVSDPYIYYDQLLANDLTLQAYLKANAEEFDQVLLDSWYVAGTAYKVGTHTLPNAIQLVQSQPEFIPETPEKIPKASYFASLARVPCRRIFTCREHMTRLGGDHYLGVAVDDEFFAETHFVRDMPDGLELVHTASNPNIPKKGVAEMLQQLALAAKSGVSIKKLTLMLGQEYSGRVGETGYEVAVLDRPSTAIRANVLALSSVYVTCTTNETPGLAQLEAIAVGLPSVAYDSGGNRDYLSDGSFVMSSRESFVADLKSMENPGVRAQTALAATAIRDSFSNRALLERFDSIMATLPLRGARAAIDQAV